MGDTQPYLEEKLTEEELDKELNKEVDKELDYLENLEELELARLSVEVEQATGFQDNVGVTVVMPGEDISKAGTNEVIEHPTCSTFLIFGVLMGCLLIVSSVMMCLLAHRLHITVAMYRQEKLIQSFAITGNAME